MDCADTPALRIAGLDACSITDGPGIRLTVFTQGCAHACPGCHNPQTHDFSGGEVRCWRQIWRIAENDPLISGLTLSGGEPFDQARALMPLVAAAGQRGLEVAAYSGYTFEQLVSLGGSRLRLLRMCDVLIDGRFVQELRSLSLRFRGSRNQRILDVKASLYQNAALELHDGRWQG